MRIEHNDGVNYILWRVNIAMIVSLVSVFTLMLIIASFRSLLFAMTVVATVACLGPSVLDVVYCSNLIIYFYIRVRFINCIMLNHIEGKPVGGGGFSWFPKVKFLRNLARNHDFATTATDVLLRKLFESFGELQKINQFPVRYFTNKSLYE